MTVRNDVIWYGVCGRWTDDFDTLECNPVPVCPDCGGPGFEALPEQWTTGIERHAKSNPQYPKFIEFAKNRCMRVYVHLAKQLDADTDMFKVWLLSGTFKKPLRKSLETLDELARKRPLDESEKGLFKILQRHLLAELQKGGRT